jgi:cation diffusion facilitator family transporter
MNKKSLGEKRKVAFFSVVAAILLTAFKLIVGLLTGSLGILSEALHSGLDLIAASITLFAVKISDKPGDEEHQYGHGKVENLSALAETLLLLITCTWIVYEALHRLFTGKMGIEVNVWSYLVVIFSIVIDFTRSRALFKVAKKHNSQALEADALHFSTDILSSSVVLIGLIFANFGFYYADPVAALLVAVIVIYISFRLGKRSVDVLLDTAPHDVTEKVKEILSKDANVAAFHDLKVRQGGATTFIEVNIHVNPLLSIEEAHEISDEIEETVEKQISRSEIHVHIEPENNHSEKNDPG